MSRKEIEDVLKGYISEQFFSGNPNTLMLDTPLLSSGILDSISALQLVDFIEETFKIQFEAHDVDQENLNSINSLTKFIMLKLNP